jgi:hypothetical protein
MEWADVSQPWRWWGALRGCSPTAQCLHFRGPDLKIPGLVLLLLFDVFEMQLRSANTFNTSTFYTKTRSDTTKTRKQEVAQNCKSTLTGIELPLFVPPWGHQAQNTPYSTALGLPLQPLIPPFAQSAIAAMSYMSFFRCIPYLFSVVLD